MAARVIQSSFNVGEIAPALYARTDVAKYHSAAALLRNFFVDYRGGASTRAGTQYILHVKDSSRPVRLLPFVASADVEYLIEFGNHYIRFFYNRRPVLETSFGYTVTLAAVLNIPGHNFAAGDWIYAAGDYFKVSAVSGDNVTLTNIGGGADPAFTSSGTAARVYTIYSPYEPEDLAKLKFVQNVSEMYICHPGYPPYALKLITAANWTMAQMDFSSSGAVPQNVQAGTTLDSGQVSYRYAVTGVDANGQESGVSNSAVLSGLKDIRVTNGTNRVFWISVAGAVSYNVYKSTVTYFGAVIPNSPLGFIGNTTSGNFDDSNISPDFSSTPPVLRNPFVGSGVAAVNVVSPGAYTSVPAVATSGGGPSTPAGLFAVLGAVSSGINSGGSGYAIGDRIFVSGGPSYIVRSVSGGAVTSISTQDPGRITSGSVPANPATQQSTSGTGTGFSINLTWGVIQVMIDPTGADYSSTPAVVFSPTGATANALLGSTAQGFPSTPAFFQQRLFLGGGTRSPAGFNLSQPGGYRNFNVSQPSQADDSISGTLVAAQLQSIKHAVPTSSGLIIFTDKGTWLLNGGTSGSAISPSSVVANPQSYSGASDLPPIVANYDILYVQAKGSIVRDSTFNIYANVYTGSDISVLSSHLFYGHELLEWAYAEEPFKVVWVVRDDGTMLSLTFLKEQEFTAWAHSDTDGVFKSVAAIGERVEIGKVDAVYTVVERNLGGQAYKIIERIADRSFTTRAGSWCVDCGLRYVGPATSAFGGAAFLAGKTVTGLADGVVIPPFVMPASGKFNLTSPASNVTVGLAFTAQLKTLTIDTGEPTIQGKQKKVPDVVVRAQNTLGLKAGTDFDHLVEMKDFKLGRVGSLSNKVVSDLVTSDALVKIDPSHNEFGQYCFQQDQPYPATILGVIPSILVGDSK